MHPACPTFEPDPGSSAAWKADCAVPEPMPTVEELYDQHFNFVWRNLTRLGVPAPHLEDAAQDVFVVVHRKLPSFEQRNTIKSWLFGITVRVAKLYRSRNIRQRGRELDEEPVLVSTTGTPEELQALRQAASHVQRLLDELDDDKRAVFVLAEFEAMTAPEIAGALGIPLNTAYSRLRHARLEFEAGVQRLRAKEDWRFR